MSRISKSICLVVSVAFVVLVGAGCPGGRSMDGAQEPAAQTSAAPEVVPEGKGEPSDVPESESAPEGEEAGAADEFAGDEVEGAPSTGDESEAEHSEPVDLRVPEAPAAGDEILPESDDRPLTNTDLEYMSNWELTLARNEIYARHGRPFTNPQIREYFEGKAWYSPNPNFSNAWLSALETRNADFILKFQERVFDIPATHP
jgi:hypothetical protein